MRLSWNEIRTRAAGFAREWADAAYEKGETQSFYNEFFEIFGKRRRDVARYEERVQRLDHTAGYIDLFWPGVLLVEQKSAGRDLTAAREQAGTYFDALTDRERPPASSFSATSRRSSFSTGTNARRPASSLPTFRSTSRRSGSSSACSAARSAIKTRSTSRRPS